MEQKEIDWGKTETREPESGFLKVSELPEGVATTLLVKNQKMVERPKQLWKNNGWVQVVDEKGNDVMKPVLELEVFPADGKTRDKPLLWQLDWAETFGSRSCLGQLKLIALAQPTRKLESTATNALWISIVRKTTANKKNFYEVKEVPVPQGIA